MKKNHILLLGDESRLGHEAISLALLSHYPDYEQDYRCRTRISVLVDHIRFVHDFIFEYQELFDNSFWRIVDLTDDKPTVRLHRPQYDGQRKDFVDIEWEFIVSYFSHPILQQKLKLWSADTHRNFSVIVAYEQEEKNIALVDKLRRRLPQMVNVKTAISREEDSRKLSELTEMAKALHYFYLASYQLNHVPTELPVDEVNKAWDAIQDEAQKLANIHNVMSIPMKMKILGHDRYDWDTFHALSAEEIERLTAVEHNRWSVERLIHGMRPCTDTERAEIEKDIRMRIADEEYAKANPTSLKKQYKTMRNAHYDLCAFSELGIDETGLPVARYDRDLTAAIPLIVKYYNDRQKAYGKG